MRDNGTEQVISRDRIVLDASASEPFEILAQLQALMCFPDKTPQGRKRIASAICADFLDQQRDLEPELAPALRAGFRQYLKSKNRVSLASHGRRWDEAFIAGWYFLVLLNEPLTGQYPALNGVPEKVSGRAVVKVMFPAREDGLEINYESRLHDIASEQIRPYYPVAHLAAAFQCAAQFASPTGYAGEFEIDNLEFLRALVNLARGFADVIRRTPKLKNIADQLIDLEWRD